ncbi:polysaccharide pyruvyl transferase family protein [Microbacterium sp. MMO-10]|uniref:polysaccharide pyruvyl transferase family protein n=1 Tax=Microbacterium sp. MMO-10 TaxID=3081272 RepID=UPI0030195A17
MRRINAIGYYGWDNFGDELFRAAIQRNRELLWGPGARVRSFITPVPALHQNLGVLGRATRLIEAIIGAVWCDTIALCGGSVLEDVRGTQRTRSGAFRKRRSIEGIGISLGPWATPAAKERVRDYVAKMDRVVVRDIASRGRIGTDVTVGGDLAALYPMPIVPASQREYLTICVSNDSKESVDDVVEFFSRLLPSVDMPVKLLALNVRPRLGDVEFAQEIHRRLNAYHPDIELHRYETIDQTIALIASSQAVWSQRLHGLIVAYLCDVPILALSHHRKISDFSAHIGLPARFLCESLVFDEAIGLAARESLTGIRAWAITPSEYKEATRAAFDMTRAPVMRE